MSRNENSGLSFDTLVAIRDCEGLNVQERCCLMMIYSRGNKHTSSMTTLAANMGYSNDRYTRRIIAGLKEKNLITVDEHSGGTHTITINLPALQTLVPQVKGQPMTCRSTLDSEVKGGMTSRSREGRPTGHTKENLKEKEKENKQPVAVAPVENDSPDTPPSIPQGKSGGVAAKTSTSSIRPDKGGLGVKDKRGATLDLQVMGTPTDYLQLSREQGIEYTYKAYLAVPRMTPRKAYDAALKKEGKK